MTACARKAVPGPYYTEAVLSLVEAKLPGEGTGAMASEIAKAVQVYPLGTVRVALMRLEYEGRAASTLVRERINPARFYRKTALASACAISTQGA